jgi:hypothetical protein
LASRSDTEFASGLSARTAAVSAGDAVLFENRTARKRETSRRQSADHRNLWHAHALPMASETPALLPVGRGFRFDNFQSRVRIRADGRPPARYHLEQYFRVRGRHVAYPYRHHAGCGDRILRPRFRGSVRALVGRHRGTVLKRSLCPPPPGTEQASNRPPSPWHATVALSGEARWRAFAKSWWRQRRRA